MLHGVIEFGSTNIYLLLICSIGLFIWRWWNNHSGYWKKQGIQYIKPLPLVGNLGGYIIHKNAWFEEINRMYNYFTDAKVVGVFMLNKPTLLIRDPNLIQSILITDFKNFVDREIVFFTVNRKLNPLNENLFFLNGDRWRELRRKLNTIFSNAKLKMMMNQIVDCVDKMNRNISGNIDQNNNPDKGMNITGVMDRLTTDVIASCAFGVENDNVAEFDNFNNWGKKSLQPSICRTLGIVINALGVVPFTSWFNIGDIPGDVLKFFTSLTFDSILYRRKNHFHRPDLLQLIMELQNSHTNIEYAVPPNQVQTMVNTVDRFDEIDIAANVFLFYIAGSETTSKTISFCLYEIALQQDIQERLRNEVRSIMEKCNGVLQYDNLCEMEYADAVISETLRKYPVLPFLSRISLCDYPIPNSDMVIKKGTTVTIPVCSLQNDDTYFADPTHFNPDRFMGENINTIINGTYMPFGIGPRQCIGIKFAKMEIKLTLANLILKYNFLPCSKTSIPIEFEKNGLLYAPKKGIWLKVKALN